MRKFITLLLLMACVVVNATPTVTLSSSETGIAPITVPAGGTATVYVYVEGVAEFTGFQGDLVLPSGLSVTQKANANLTKDGDGNATHSCSFSALGGGTYTLMSFSTTLSLFNGDSGSIMKLTLSGDDGFAGGEFYFSNVSFVDPWGLNITQISETPHSTIACSSTVPVASITLSRENAEIQVGNSITLSATILPDNARKVLNWSSSDPAVATVDNNGMVTGVSVGTATIKAETTDGSGKFATCVITVVEPVVYELKVTLSGSETEITPVIVPMGGTATAYVYAEGVADFTAFQADLMLPPGISITKKAAANLTKDDDGEATHQISYQGQGNGVWILLIFSTDMVKFNGDKGALMKVTLSANPGFAGGEFYYKDVIFTDVASHKTEIAESEHGTIASEYVFTLGDVNSDGVLTVADMTGTVNFILDENTAGLSFDAADVVTDGKILVNDLKEVTDLVLAAAAPAKPNMAKGDDEASNSVGFRNDYIVKGETNIVPLALNRDAGEYTGMQFDLQLPEGMSIENVSTGDGARNHKIVKRQMENGAMRIIVFSMESETFSGADVVELGIRADETMSDGEYGVMVENISLSTPLAQNVEVAECESIVSVGETTGVSHADNSQFTIHNSQLYNLQGVRVNENYKGIVISNGKKYILK